MIKKAISIRLSEEVIKTLEFKSEALNMNKTEYITNAILNSDVKINNSRDISSLLASINKIGNNINQISYSLNKANKDNKLDDVNYSNMLDKLVILEHHLKDILRGY